MPTMSEIQFDSSDKVVSEIYQHFKKGGTQYDEDKHCKLLIRVMRDPKRGTVEAFCFEAMLSERAFYKWTANHKVFGDLYVFCKLVARQIWEQRGEELANAEYAMGTINYAFEHWKMLGWSRFGISKNNRLKLKLKSGDTPAQHYGQILDQAADGDFTASEFKQLMEAVNVGLNVVAGAAMQKEIDELKSDLVTMQANSGVQNPFTNKGTA